MNINLYPHNQETYDKIIAAWQNQNRVATVQATGTGKSMLILKCLFTYPEGNKLVLAPSNHILDQLVGKVDSLPNTILMTYSKLSNMSDAELEELNLKIIVLDEFHRCGAESWGSGVGKLLAKYPDAKILGTTATPIRYLDGGRDMSDELFDGNVVTNLSLPQAIVKGILSMPTYISALYTFEDEILNLNEKINKSSNSDEEKDDMRKQVEQMKKKLDKSKGIPVILKKYLGKASGKFIVFCRDKKHLFEVKNTVAEWFIKGKVNSTVVSYEVFTGNDEKDDVIVDQFRNAKVDNSIHLLFSINKLNEGLHVDDVDGVIFLRSTVSPIVYYQQLGRALKVGGNKPYVFDFVNNFNSLSSRNFASDIKEEVEKENEQRRVKGEQELNIEDFAIYDDLQYAVDLFNEVEGQLQSNWDIMLERYCAGEDSREVTKWGAAQRQCFKNGLLSLDKVNMLNSVNFSWNPYDEQWNIMLQRLISGEESRQITAWKKNQRTSFKAGKLTQHKIDKLNSANFIWNPLDESWSIMFQKYSIGESSKEVEGWKIVQRKNFKKGKIDQHKINQLDDINFDWEPKETAWNRYFEVYCSYKEQHGHCNIAAKYIIDGMKAGQWGQHQRKFFKNGKLSQDRIDKLNSIGFVWDPFDSEWHINFDLLCTYKSIHGHCNVPVNYEIEEMKLGIWVSTQRKKYKQGKLSPERIAKLEAIGFQWSTR